jgi:putative DNA primase/helicase
MAIFPKRYDTWDVFPTLWSAIVARPGGKKTPAIKKAVRPIIKLEDLAQKAFQDRQHEVKAKLAIIEAKRKLLLGQIADAAKANNEKLLVELQKNLVLLEEQSSQVNYRKRFVVGDSTTEKLLEILSQNPNGVVLIRDELMALLKSWTKPGREGDRELYLEMWSNGRHQSDRVSRGSTTVKGMHVNIIAGTQPKRLEAYVNAADKGEDDDGLLQRFQAAVYPDFESFGQEIDRRPDETAQKSAFDIFKKLESFDPQELGVPLEVKDDVPCIRFSEEGQELFDEWHKDLEKKLKARDLHPLVESHLSKYRSLMPALALIFHAIALVSVQKDCPLAAHNESNPELQKHRVNAAEARLAACWCDLLEAHALKIYASAVDVKAIAVKILIEKIEQGNIRDNISVRDLYRHGWAYLNTRESAIEALSVLEEHNWVRISPISPSPAGRPSEIIRLHPDLRLEA